MYRRRPGRLKVQFRPQTTFYREIYIANTLTNEKGDKVKLKPGADVEVTVEAVINAPESRENSKTSLPEKTEDRKW